MESTEMRIDKDKFVWLIIGANKAKEIFSIKENGLDLYQVLPGGSESLIESAEQLHEIIQYGGDIGIEVGSLVDDEVHLLYSCDAWHSSNSKILLGVYTSHAEAVIQADNHSKKSEEGDLTVHDTFLLGNIYGGIKQTQGRSENYIIEEVKLNEEL